jgi:hypothetical protein
VKQVISLIFGHREREGVRKASKSKRKKLGGSERHFISGTEKIILLEDSQAMPARPDKDGLRVSTLGW